jgi:hypothetical protein
MVMWNYDLKNEETALGAERFLRWGKTHQGRSWFTLKKGGSLEGFWRNGTRGVQSHAKSISGAGSMGSEIQESRTDSGIKMCVRNVGKLLRDITIESNPT